jgi:hypothetical protein
VSTPDRYARACPTHRALLEVDASDTLRCPSAKHPVCLWWVVDIRTGELLAVGATERVILPEGWPVLEEPEHSDSRPAQRVSPGRAAMPGRPVSIASHYRRA